MLGNFVSRSVLISRFN